MVEILQVEMRQVEMRPVEQLVAWARNSRTHSEEQVATIAASIEEFGCPSRRRGFRGNSTRSSTAGSRPRSFAKVH